MIDKFEQKYQIGAKLKEEKIWWDASHIFAELPESARKIWNHGLPELANNAIEHSEGTSIAVHIQKFRCFTHCAIEDDGTGIFNKIKKALELEDEQHGFLELLKGKFTTDPSRHSGEGIFFSSRIFDVFEIYSGNLCFSRTNVEDKNVFPEFRYSFPIKGTIVSMILANDSQRIIKDVFDDYTTENDGCYDFTKTAIPLRYLQNENDLLVSRSQARRLLTRLDQFETVILDFDGIDEIGQAFGDEIFRVFQNSHPKIDIQFINANDWVRKMISRAAAKRN